MLSAAMPEAILVASWNPRKVKEIEQFLSLLPIRVAGLDSLPDLPPCLECGHSFEENAVLKAKYYSQFSLALTLADDSGLVVDALNGQPGIFSARFVSESATDNERCRQVLLRMQKIPENQRAARFVCCIALAHRGRLLCTFEGIVEGVIGTELRGEMGFGYDPIFFLPEIGKTMAELEFSEKFQVSHRGRALRKLGAALAKMVPAELLENPP